MLKPLSLAVLAAALLTTPAMAATAKSYQVTGPVLAMDDTTITVQKGTEKWQLNKGSAAVPADLKVGDKVTISYSMTADKITSKAK